MLSRLVTFMNTKQPLEALTHSEREDLSPQSYGTSWTQDYLCPCRRKLKCCGYFQRSWRLSSISRMCGASGSWKQDTVENKAFTLLVLSLVYQLYFLLSESFVLPPFESIPFGMVSSLCSFWAPRENQRGEQFLQKLAALLVLAAKRPNSSQSQNKDLNTCNQRSSPVSHPLNQKAKWASLDLK